MLDRIEMIEKPVTPPEIAFSFDLPKLKSPEMLIKIEEAFIGRSDPLFFIREATMTSGERIGIVGENGVGKSTFIKTLLASLPDDTLSMMAIREMMEASKHPRIDNTLIENEMPIAQKLKVLEGYLSVTKTISVGYYSQMHESLSTHMTIEENFASHRLPYSAERIGGILNSYGFGYHDGKRKVS